jgi:hypothetical protein
MSARFLAGLDVSLVDEPRNIWRLHEPLPYWSRVLSATVIVPAGFETDFASVPRLPLVYLACGDVGRRAAVLHDYLYRTGQVSRPSADAVFREALLADGVSRWRAWLMWSGVRAMGWKYYNDQKGEV